MPDFTNSLYLGRRHAHSQLMPWQSLTVGKPAVLSEPEIAKQIARKIAQLQGLEAGLLAPSTLHLFWDLLGLFDPKYFKVYKDDLLYPIATWGLEHAISKGMKMQGFRHLHAFDLSKKVYQDRRDKRRPIVLTDGFCPRCGKIAPIRDYLKILKPLNGLLILDDTQALGILGKRSSSKISYGRGGGGSLAFANSAGENIIAISSLAKAFGVPVAVLTGAEKMIQAFENNSKTRLNNSPASNAHIEAARQALIWNQIYGERTRKHLIKKVLYFKKGLNTIGLSSGRGYFPVQSIENLPKPQAVKLNEFLQSKNIQTMLLSPHGKQKTVLSILINTEHQLAEIKFLLKSIQQYLLKTKTQYPTHYEPFNH